MFFLCQALCLDLGLRDTDINNNQKKEVIHYFKWEETGWEIAQRGCDIELEEGYREERRGQGKSTSAERCHSIQFGAAGSQGPWRRAPEDTSRQGQSDHKEHWRTYWRLGAPSWNHWPAPTDVSAGSNMVRSQLILGVLAEHGCRESYRNGSPVRDDKDSE